jgi:hypothetical protein
VAIFKPLNPRYKKLANRIDKYQDTKFYDTIDLNDDVQEKFLLDTIASYENFILYLKDPSIIKDHTYLWDIFTTKNSELITREINLIIIQIVNDDSTEKIKFVCPSSVYSSQFYNKHNENVILLNKNNYYEPICIYMEYKDETIINKLITKTFNVKQLRSMKMDNIINILELINENIFNKCYPKTASKENIHKTKHNITANQLYKIIKEVGEYTVQCQVFNYSHKVIGLFIKDKQKREIFIPCYPSQPIEQIIQITYIDNPHLWSSFDETIENLEKVYFTHNKRIPCKATHVVIETKFKKRGIPIHKLVVGILTETNQFIQVIERPYNETEHTLPIIEQSNINTIDKIITTSHSTEDNERVKVVNQILLEGKLYSAFRTTMRYLLNDYQNRGVKKEILNFIGSDRYYYKDKLKMIKKRLREISVDDVEFSEYDLSILNDINLCHNGGGEMVDEACKLHIPKKNLVNHQDNEFYYYFRLADELLRYNRIRLYMLENMVNIVDIEYKIDENELIILKNLLIPEGKNIPTYFDNLEIFQKNKYVHTITFDNTQPFIANTVDEMFEANVQNKNDIENNPCILEEREVVGNKDSIWKKFFNQGKEIIFNNEEEYCTFEVLIFILKQVNEKQGTEITIEYIKSILIKHYKSLAQYLPVILNIWVFDKKITKSKMNEMDIQKVEDFINSGKYFITDIDIWFIADALQLPIIIFCSTGLKLFKNFKLSDSPKTWVSLLKYDPKQHYYFIRTPSEDRVDKSIKPKYQLIIPKFKPDPTLFINPIPEQTNALVHFLRTISKI